MSTPERPKTNAEKAIDYAFNATTAAKIYATLALADAIRQAGTSIGGALVEAARIGAGHRR